jgi:putative endonuclease
MAVKDPGDVCWYLYMVRCHDGSLYTGIATDVERRFGQHQGSGGGGSKYLRGRGPLNLVFQERVGDRSQALKVETRVKRLSKEKKELLVGGHCGIEAMVRRTEFRRERPDSLPGEVMGLLP